MPSEFIVLSHKTCMIILILKKLPVKRTETTRRWEEKQTSRECSLLLQSHSMFRDPVRNNTSTISFWEEIFISRSRSTQRMTVALLLFFKWGK